MTRVALRGTRTSWARACADMMTVTVFKNELFCPFFAFFLINLFLFYESKKCFHTFLAGL